MARLSQVFLPRDREFFDLFEEAAGNIHRAAELLEQMLRDYPEKSELAREILICEQQGDRVTHDIVQRLNNTFVTPIDREDIHALALALDDVADAIDDCAKLMELYRLDRVRPGVRELARILSEATEHVLKAMEALRDKAKITTSTAEIDRLEHDGDVAYQQSIVALFDHEKDPIQVIKWKELYETMEAVTDRCEDVVNVIEGIVLKMA